MRNIRNSLILLLLMSFAAGPVYGQEGLSLADAIARGLENNFQIRIARQNLEIASNNNSWGTAGRYPTIDLGFNYNHRYNDEPSTTMPGEREHYTLGRLTPSATLRWTLFNGFAISITKSKLAHLNKISEGNAAIAVENTIQGIVLAYYKVLLEKEKSAIVEDVKKLSKDRYDYILTKKEVGAAATFDVLQAKIAWLDDTAAALLQQTNYRNALRNLSLVLGEPAEKQYDPTDTFSADMKDYKIDDLLEKLYANNKTLKNQYINQKILKKDISLQRSSLYPMVSLTSGVEQVGTRIKYPDLPAVTSTTYDYYVNFSVSLNLFKGGNTRRAIANAKIQEKIGHLQLDEIKLSLGNLLRSMFEIYNARKKLYTVAEERINSAKLNLDISDEKFKAGAINSFNYRDVQLLYLNAAFGKLQAIYDLIDTHSELMRLTGSVISEY